MSKKAHIVAVELPQPEFTGFKPVAFEEFLASAATWIGPRPVLEELDPETHVQPNGNVLLQVIPYIVLQHGGRALAYVRPSLGNEARLHGKVSIGLGGHIDLGDVVHEESIVNLPKTIAHSAAREVEEETGLQVEPDRVKWTGLIYRKDGPVDRVHLGCVGVIELNDADLASLKRTSEIGETRFLPISAIETEMAGYEIEAWTQALIEAA